MRLDRSLAWDLILVALVSVFSSTPLNFSHQPMQLAPMVLELSIAVIPTGYLLILSLFPSRNGLSPSARTILCLGTSAFLVAISGLILNYRIFQPNHMAIILLLLTILLASIAYVRRAALPSRKRFVLWPMRNKFRRSAGDSILIDARRRVVSLWNGSRKFKWAFLGLGIGLFLVAVVSLAVNIKGWGLVYVTAATFILLAFLMAATAYIPWSALLSRKRPIVRSIWRGRRPARPFAALPPVTTRAKFASMLLTIALICALVALALNSASHYHSNERNTTEGIGSVSLLQKDHLLINSHNNEGPIKRNNTSSNNEYLAKNPLSSAEQEHGSSTPANNSTISGSSIIYDDTPSAQVSGHRLTT